MGERDLGRSRGGLPGIYYEVTREEGRGGEIYVGGEEYVGVGIYAGEERGGY